MNQLEYYQLQINRISNKIDNLNLISLPELKLKLTPNEIEILKIYFDYQDVLKFKYDNLIYYLIN